MRIGHGYDAHRFANGRRLVLGGVDIPHKHGLDGHSDADVLTHAVIDALLGATALGDIGMHFPPTDPQHKDADSLRMLHSVAELLASRGFSVVNIDATVVAQQPRLAEHVVEMRKNIADAVDMNINLVSVKATTEEHMGFTGRCEGIAAHAVCLVE